MTEKIINRDHIVAYTNRLLNIDTYKDYSPNGLQVEGTPYIERILSAVSANQRAVDAAAENGYNALLVHHGWFWRGESPSITGIKKQRLKALLSRDINLLAYHIPLDANRLLGNNQALGHYLGIKEWDFFGEQNLGCIGNLPMPMTLSQLSQSLTKYLHRSPKTICNLANKSYEDKVVQRTAWCTGAAQSFFTEAITAGAEVFISGEVSEPCVHLATETQVAYLACGHHATERNGVRNLGNHLAKKFAIIHHFIDLDSGE